MPHDGSMCRSSETPLDRIMSGLRDLPSWLAEQPTSSLGEVITKSRQIIDRTEAIGADATRRFDKAGGYKTDGFVDVVAWLRVNGKLSGNAAAERVEVAHQLKQLPRTRGSAGSWRDRLPARRDHGPNRADGGRRPGPQS
jgi:hypothetical protein